MKRVNNTTTIKLAALLFVASFTFSSGVSAQQSSCNAYGNIDWQFNLPIETNFADRLSGWGLNIDGGYYITKDIGVGLFVSYHTNREYIPRQTMNLSETSSLTSDQQHSLFQLPFGVSSRYAFYPGGRVQPYLGLKLGANYAKTSSHMNIFRVSDDSWGFHVSPEIGANVYVDPQKTFAIHIASYYSYSTNTNDVLIYSVDGISNWGIRVGIAF